MPNFCHTSIWHKSILTIKSLYLIAIRDNKPPVAVIYPKYKEITLPLQKFVLDGSRSSDDDKIVKYEWELVAGPLNYYLKKKTESVLQLTSLEPGTYKFKLTVTDSDGVQNSTLAKVKVNKGIFG